MCAIYSYAYTHIHVHAGYILTQWIMTSEGFFWKICTSHFIVRVRKGLFRVLLWEGVGDRTETAIYWPHSYGHQRCVFLVLLMLNQRLGGSTFCWVLAFSTTSCHQRVSETTGGPEGLFGRKWLSLPHLISNFSDPQLIRGPESSFGLAWLSLPHLVSNSNCLTSCHHRVI